MQAATRSIIQNTVYREIFVLNIFRMIIICVKKFSRAAVIEAIF